MQKRDFGVKDWPSACTYSLLGCHIPYETRPSAYQSAVFTSGHAQHDPEEAGLIKHIRPTYVEFIEIIFCLFDRTLLRVPLLNLRPILCSQPVISIGGASTGTSPAVYRAWSSMLLHPSHNIQTCSDFWWLLLFGRSPCWRRERRWVWQRSIHRTAQHSDYEQVCTVTSNVVIVLFIEQETAMPESDSLDSTNVGTTLTG